MHNKRNKIKHYDKMIQIRISHEQMDKIRKIAVKNKDNFNNLYSVELRNAIQEYIEKWGV